MAHTGCPSGHDMWNGDGKPVVWAFRIGFFRKFAEEHEEYYSYALYCLLKKLPNASVKYNQAKGWEDVDCHIELTSSTNAGKWKIKYLRAKDKFSVIDASGVQSLYSTVEDAKYALEKLL